MLTSRLQRRVFFLTSICATAATLGCAPTSRSFGSGGGDSAASTTSGAGGQSSASASSQSSAGAGGQSSASAASSSAAGIAEDCTNGVDDDKDGHVDCEDPDCNAGFVCAPDVPTGWKGPVAFYTGPDAPPACDQGWGPQAAVGGLDFIAPGYCDFCSCGSPTGLSCDPPKNTFYTGLSCDAGAIEFQYPAVNTCAQMNIAMNSSFLGPVTASGGSCVPSGGAPLLEPPSFGTSAAACSAPAALGAGCTLGACVPKPPPAFGAPLCIFLTGDQPCPPGPYTEKSLMFTEIADSRACTACGCGSPKGSCPATSKLFYNGNTTCSNLPAAYPNSGYCQTGLNGLQVTSSVVELTGSPKGSCAPSGGEMIGGVSGAKPITFCCSQP